MISTDDYITILETCPIRGQDDAILRAMRYIELGYPVMFYGPPGNGKTSIAEHILSYFGGGPDSFYKIESTEGMSEYHIIGGFHPLAMSGNAQLAGEHVFKDGVLTRAIRDGKNLLIDEFTRAPSSAYSGIFLMLSMGTLPLEYREEVIEKPDGWILIATANFGDEGTYKLSNALKRRFVAISVDYPSRATEKSLLKKITPGLNPMVVDTILDFSEETRAIWKKDRGFSTGLSTDGIIKMARYCELSIAQGTDKSTAFIDAALHQGTIIADETDPYSVQRVQELVWKIGEKLN